MSPRALLILALLASPAGAQEPTPNRSSFDLSNASVKKIVRDTAATQYSQVLVSNDAPVKAEPDTTIQFVPPEKSEKPRAPAVPRLKPAPPPGGFLSQVVGILVDEAVDAALGVDSADYSTAYPDRWDRCEGREALKTTTLQYDTCPAKNRENLSTAGP